MAEKLLVDDPVMRKLLPAIGRCAQYLKGQAAAGRRFYVKFDGDGDGISAGILVYHALKACGAVHIASVQAPTAAYDVREAEKDLRNANGPEDTVFVFLDHAANPESADGIALVRKTAAGVAFIDHHPYSPEIRRIADAFVSPMEFVEQGASYNTGLLAFEVARRMDAATADERLAFYSMQTDKSRFAKKTDFKEPVAIEYAAFNHKRTLKYYDNLLADPERLKDFHEAAVEKTEAALEKAEDVADYRKSGRGVVALVHFEEIIRPTEYPSRSKIITEFQVRHEKGHPGLVTLGLSQKHLGFRASRRAVELGFDAAKVIGELKKEFGKAIRTGGGHSVAASLKAESEHLPAIAREAARLAALQMQ
ncbi:MAG: DHH family phosphoesterase [Candidatus Micrarchaeota archaeon]